MSRTTLALVACLAVTTAAVPEAEAQAKKPTTKERDVARQAYNDGTMAYEKGDYAAALEGFEKANATIPSPHAQYWIAMSYDKLGKKEEAIKAFETLLADPDVAKIGDEKLTIARDRLAELKKPEPEPEPAATEEKPAEPAPAETEYKDVPLDLPPEQPPPEAPPEPADDDLAAKGGLFELGLITGPLFVSSSHNLHEERFTHTEYGAMAWLIGARVGFLFHKYAGIEAEYAHGFGSVEQPSPGATVGSGGDSAQFNTIRGHLLGQVPLGRFIPFGLVGVGDLQATSDRLGADGDFLLYWGVGAKVTASKIFTPRLDMRFNLTQKEGGSFGDGVALHPEILLGLGLTLGR